MKANIMPNKHAQGPWMLNGNTVEAYPDLENSLSYIAPVCTVDDDWNPDITQANARLIAAAPDLLAALQACLLRDDIASDELGEVIRAAIAKAIVHA